MKVFVLLAAAICTMLGCGRSHSSLEYAADGGDSEPQMTATRDERRPIAVAPEGFEVPVRLMAQGKPIEVQQPGYACPTVADVDGDGKQDLVVGQFSEGAMRYFRNTAATGQSPQLAAGDWIRCGDERAVVPGVW